MEGEEFDALVADIKANGLHDPIIELGNAILDGRNRYRACLAAGIPIRTEEFIGGDPLGYVLSVNLHRRHLNESQRAMVAAKLATMPRGRPRKNAEISAISQSDAARLLRVDRRTVQHATAVRDKGVPELAQRVERGEVSVSVAAKIAEFPFDQQATAASADEATMRGTAKKWKRARRVVELGVATEKAARKLGKKIYCVVYADPPWQFESRSLTTGMDRSAANHYQTMPVDDICAIPVPAGGHAVLFLWAIVPMLPEALSVIQAWGFTYKSHFVWIKDQHATGFWNRGKHELLLVGTRGNVPAPAPGEQFSSVIEAPVGDHSEKPACVAEMIKKMFPALPAIELFARGPREGFDVWGNEATGRMPIPSIAGHEKTD